MSDSITIACVQMESVLIPETNLQSCLDYISLAMNLSVDLLIFPESTSSRTDDPDGTLIGVALDGAFVLGLIEALGDSEMTVIVGIIEKQDDGRPYNTLVAIQRGEIIATYRKIHLYDACDLRESDSIRPGYGPLTTINVGGFRVGMMTCYDIRFPEAARLLAEQGAGVIAIPTSWAAGPLKEDHWGLFCRSRAVENTVYIAGSAQTGGLRVGLSMIVGPDGVPRSMLGRESGIALAHIERDQITTSRMAFPLLEQRRFSINPVPLVHTSEIDLSLTGPA